MDFSIRVEDARILSAIQSLLAMARNATPIMREIAAIGENSTRLRFRTETAPDGSRWKPSLRVRMAGGRTLTKDGHLADSVSGNAGKDFAEWGVNRPYAAIHQFGGEIKARSGGFLRFRLANGAWASVKSVVIPDRPFLGVSDDDAEDILDVLGRHINNLTGQLSARFGGAHAG